MIRVDSLALEAQSLWRQRWIEIALPQRPVGWLSYVVVCLPLSLSRSISEVKWSKSERAIEKLD